MKKYLFVLLSFFVFQSGTILNAAEFRAKGVKKVHLDNGLTVLIKEDHNNPVVSVQVWVKAGAVNEDEKTAGLSHFLEHLIFKGTEKYPGQEISRQVETQGGVINAGTSKEYTQFYIDIQKDAYAIAVDILADAMFNPTFPADEIEKERPVVIEEIIRHLDNPRSVLYELFSESIFLKSAYKNSVIGTEKVIRNVSREEIVNYYRKYYVPSNMIVSIAGDLKTSEALKLVKTTFGKAPKSETPSAPKLIEEMHSANLLHTKKDVAQTYWLGGFIGPEITSDEQFAADIAANILGGGRSSRLYRKIREEKQLVYSVGGFFLTQRGSGAMVFSVVCSTDNEKDAITALRNEIDIFAKDGPSVDELKRAKEMLKSQWHFGKETVHEQASLLGYWHMQGNPKMIDIYLEKLEKVSKEDVVNLLNKYYAGQGLSEAVIEPTK